MAVILHVEDEGSVRFLYKEVFEELGHQVIPAVSGEEALAIIRKSRPDLIILDLKMPGMGGRGFLERFRRMRTKIPVVISTAYPYLAPDQVTDSAEAYIVKSGDLDELIQKVEALLGKARSPVRPA